MRLRGFDDDGEVRCHRPRRLGARVHGRRRHRGDGDRVRRWTCTRAKRYRALGRDPLRPHAARRRRVRLLPGRRMRARHELRPDRRVRVGRSASRRPASGSSRRGRDAAAHPCGRQGARHGRDPLGPAALGARGARCRLVARVVAREAWLDGGEEGGVRHRRQGPDREPAREGGGQRCLRGAAVGWVDYERRVLYLAFASEDAGRG